MAIYEMGPWATAVEWAMVQQLGSRIGWRPGEFAGLATHGGSLANLTALLSARNVTLGDCWQQGVTQAGLPPVIVVHSRTHDSVARAAGILGLPGGTGTVMRPRGGGHASWQKGRQAGMDRRRPESTPHRTLT
jgi:L-2,4-diaminobutyrate decarboxylase